MYISTFLHAQKLISISLCIPKNEYVFVFGHGAVHLVRTQFYMLSGPTHSLFACSTQWKCIGGLTPPNPPRCVRTKWKVPMQKLVDLLAVGVVVVVQRASVRGWLLFQGEGWRGDVIYQPYWWCQGPGGGGGGVKG